MSDTLATFKIKLHDLVDPQLKKMSKRLQSVKGQMGGFGKQSDKSLGKTAKKMSVVNNLGRLAAARNGMSSFSSLSRVAASGMNPLIIGLGIAGAGAVKLGYEMAKAGVEMQKNLQMTKQLLGGTAKETAHLTSKAMALTNVYGGDYASTIQTASKLARQFGISNEQAFELIKQGYASGANLGGDMLQSLEDSASVFKNLGVTGEQQIAILQQSISNGIKDTPKLLESFNDNLPDLGGDVKRLLDKNFGDGFTKNLKKNLDKGQVTAVQALKSISDAVANTSMSNSTAQGLAEQVFGDKSGSAVELLKNFSKFDTNLGSLVKKNSSFNQAKTEQLALEERLAQAQLKSSAGFAALAQSGQNMLTRVKIGFYDAVNLAGSFYNKVTGLFSAVTGLASRMVSLKVVAMGIKLAWDVLIGGLSLGWKTLKFVVGGTFDFITNGLNALSSLVDYVMGSSIVKGMTNGFLEIKESVSDMLDYVSTPLNRLKDALAGIFTMLKGIKNFDYSQIKAGLDEVKSGISGATQRERENKGIDEKKLGEQIVKAGEKGTSSDKSIYNLNDGKDKAKKTQFELNKSTERITGGGSQVRNITVNVEKLGNFEKVIIDNASNMSMKDIESKMMELLVRLIQGTEVAINRG